MELENHKEEVPFAHYAALFSQMEPGEMQARLPEIRLEANKIYVNLLGREYRISWPEYRMEAVDGGALPSLPTQTFLLRYLLEGRSVPWLGQWRTFREMPWGELYIKPYTGRVLTRAAYAFGPRLEDFHRAGAKLGGEPVSHGDVGFRFDLIGPYKMQILVWAGDEEFPPNAQVLYSDNFAQGFAAEDRVVAGDILISHIKNVM